MSNKTEDYGKKAVEAHKKYGGKVAIHSKMPLDTQEDLSIAYTPGVAQPCLDISENRELAYDYTNKQNTVAVVSDGSAVLGLGNIGPEASMPVMEGKAVLFKKFADVDAIPIVLSSQNTEEIITAVKMIAPTFGGINLEDISAPRCFEIEKRLKEELDIPVMHDDQHGTAVVTLAGIINALKVTGKKFEDLKVVINGAGAAGMAIIYLLREVGVKQIIMCDSRGIIHKDRGNLTSVKEEVAKITNENQLEGDLEDAVQNTDVFIGVSVPGVLTPDMVRSMNDDPIIFAMANPIPEIMPAEAVQAGARIIATGRSDFPNQINNVLAFPGIFRGLLDARASKLTNKMYIAAAYAIADVVKEPNEDKIIPGPFDEGVAEAVAKAVKKSAIDSP
ncbi:NAD(P)-dependent malic enzyme [Rhodohalobacter barkolensis]|uniref:NAD-dependent malic enzyme n=1 Tax=Rhodohalobacter barkolensis TaxID=2053187 RepID=A0A2N0VFY3_9BACT|nr:NADP-dependent malic enzyme [Rhodohalobacter barkolensis]PKD43089.1 NAD-dependent malic enzyme [Rhodohalobacter barkolensis]